MDCTSARELVSADLDGELPADRRPVLDRHLRGCAECRGWADRAHRLHLRVRLRPAEPVPDLTTAILARVPAAAPSVHLALRYALAAVAAVLVVIELPLLVLGEQAGASEHLSRHLGAFGVALAAGLAVAAWRPERADGLVPLALTLGVTVVVSGVVDLANGRSSALAEAHHVVELVGVTLVWLMAGRRSPLAWARPNRPAILGAG